jgi:hypothetical protein
MSGGETEKIARLAELVSNDICVFRGVLGCHSHGGGVLERIFGESTVHQTLVAAGGA